MRTKVLVIILLCSAPGGLAERPNGHQCYVCQKKGNDRFMTKEECLQEKNIQSCYGLQRGCETHIRWGAGGNGEDMVQSVCKQIEACQNNLNANGVDCKPVCRCCCRGRLCNEEDILTSCGKGKLPTKPAITTRKKKMTTPKRTTPAETTTTPKITTEATSPEIITTPKPTTRETTTETTTTTTPKNPVCPSPPEGVVNGYRDTWYNLGDTYFSEYACNSGFCMTGTNTLNCTTSTGKWIPALPQCAEKPCKFGTKNIIFVIDRSGSVGNKNFEHVRKFLRGFTRKMDDNDSDIKISIVAFSGDSRTITTGFESNPQGLRQKIKNMKSKISSVLHTPATPPGETCTGDGMETAVSEYEKLIQDSTTKSPVEVWLFTDGKTKCQRYIDGKLTYVSDKQKNAAIKSGDYFRTAGVTVLGFAIGKKEIRDEFLPDLKRITANKTTEVNNYEEFEERALEIVGYECNCPDGSTEY